MESQTKSPAGTTPSSDSDFVTSAALATEIKAFCSVHHLTPREGQILGSLVEGIVRIKDIAVRMSLSPNTVNNHVNSIFVKTKARSKSQLLSYVLTYVAEELQAARALRRRVRVAVIDADHSASCSVVGELNARGFEAASFETPFPMTSWPEGLDSWKPEFVVLDHVSMASSEQASLIECARRCGAQVAFCGQTENPVARRAAMAAGAIEWFAKPCDTERLVELLMAHAISVSDATSAMARAILFEKKAHPFKVARMPINVRKDHLGMGGAFISNEELLAAVGTGVQAGDWLEFNLNVEDHLSTAPARGQVVWRAAEGEAPGAGVRFSYVDFDTRSWLSSVLLEQGSRSYIPAGAIV
jgi:DNA-binding NarL/FixJ family response regulator